jgi:hypothetical protein
VKTTGGRPNRRESRQREDRFAELLAAGKTARAAGREARIDPWRAFGLATDPGFWAKVADYRKQLERGA